MIIPPNTAAAAAMNPPSSTNSNNRKLLRRLSYLLLPPPLKGHEPDHGATPGGLPRGGDGQGQGAQLPHDFEQPTPRGPRDGQGGAHGDLLGRAGGQEALPPQVAQGTFLYLPTFIYLSICPIIFLSIRIYRLRICLSIFHLSAPMSYLSIYL